MRSVPDDPVVTVGETLARAGDPVPALCALAAGWAAPGPGPDEGDVRAVVTRHLDASARYEVDPAGDLTAALEALVARAAQVAAAAADPAGAWVGPPECRSRTCEDAGPNGLLGDLWPCSHLTWVTDRQWADARGPQAPAGGPTVADLQDVLGQLSRYVDWRWVTEQLPTRDKELFADTVQAWAARRGAGRDEPPMVVDRWWRGDTPPQGWVREEGRRHG
jgi:hypothetical protein